MQTNTLTTTNPSTILLYRQSQRQRILIASTVLLIALLGPFDRWSLTSPIFAQTKSKKRRASQQITSKISSKHSMLKTRSLNRAHKSVPAKSPASILHRTTWTPRPSPTHWLSHYLPEDRPRIAGGVWKFLSTDTDNHYHRPDSTFMLSQSSDQIIGFASAADAEEAGYLPGPSVNDTDRQNGRWFEGGSQCHRAGRHRSHN